MRFYLVASGRDNVETLRRSAAPQTTRTLLSYHYHKNVDLDDLFSARTGNNPCDVFVDSGGFSAATQGIHVDMRAYGDWLTRWKHRITAYANFDAIGDAATTRLNQTRMEDMGFTPIPVFHYGEDWSYLTAYLARYPYIALGGLVPIPWQRAMPWLVRCFKMARGTGAVYHGFGVSSWETLKAFPWYSADASTWTSAFRFGDVRIFNRQTGRWHIIVSGDRAKSLRHASLLRSYGVDPMDVALRSRFHGSKLAPASVLSWVRAETYCERIHGPVTLPSSR